MIAKSQSFFLPLFACVLLLSAATPGLAKRSAADQRLYEQARAACNSRAYPNGARIVINYPRGWFRCEDPKFRKR